MVIFLIIDERDLFIFVANILLIYCLNYVLILEAVVKFVNAVKFINFSFIIFSNAQQPFYKCRFSFHLYFHLDFYGSVFYIQLF